MDETMNDGEKKQGVSKKLIAILVIAILVIGGSVAAYMMLNLSDKEKYFLAEKKSLEFMTETVQDRFQPELDWLKQTEEKPSKSVVELSADANMPDMGNPGEINPQEIINNAAITLTSQADMNKKQMATELKAGFSGMEIDDIHFYLTDEKAMIGLPFLDELLQIKSEDIGKLLHEADPASFTGEENPDFGTFFETNVIPEDDQAYIEKEYIEMIYDKLPDSAFKAEDETVKVNDDTINAEKLTMHLTEEEVKELLTETIKKMQKDDRLKEIIQEQYEAQQFGMSANVNPELEDEFDLFMEDFDSALDMMADGIQDVKLPDGLTSTIWTKDKLIVQRDFSVEAGTSADDTVTMGVKGTQMLEDDKQTFDYDFTFTDQYDEQTMNLTADLSSKDNKAKDSIKLTANEITLAYEGNSTLKEGKRDFERTFSLEEPFSGGGSLVWSGSADYEKDKMSAQHDLSLDALEAGITSDMFTLHVKNSGKTIKSVDMPEDDNVKDLGSMNMDELETYFEAEVTPKAQQWLFSLIGAGAMGF
jgi:uncharacterized protein YxeA